jgi:hypothetical protein
MKDIVSKTRRVMPRWVSLVIAAVMVWTLIGVGFGAQGKSVASLAASGSPSSGGPAPAVACPGGQCFTDVPATHPFFAFINSLYMDNIISGYPCGGTGEPCDPQNRPYYRPSNNVTRGQMAKFVDNGRRNIADAVGSSLYISTSAAVAVHAQTGSVSGEALLGECQGMHNGCTAVAGQSLSGGYGGYFEGGRGGVVAISDDSGYPAVKGTSSGANAYGGEFFSPNYVSLRVDPPSSDNGYVQLGVNGVGTSLNAEIINNGALYVGGNLTVTGSKSGYVVDAMQNVDSVPLEPGDVVTIVGSGPPVLGQIPVVTVKKASTPYDTGVAGVVDQVLYVPDTATRAAYQAQQEQLQKAEAQRNAADEAARAQGTKPDYSNIVMPAITVTDEQGNIHAIDGAAAASVPSGSYANVVTLGSYKAVKVDASFGAIHTGDLLVASSHAGYAMKATDKNQAFGAVIGKALGNLDNGIGTIPVLVTLK